ncbi:hypothetical protein D9M68_642180 [compost metagenome]
MSLQQERDLELRYALAKQVPDMERGFSIHTNYGDIQIDAEDAPKIIDAVRKLLERQLRTLQQGGRQ